MATETQLIAWAIENRESLKLRIEHTTWIKEFFPDLTDIAVHLEYGGRSYRGWAWGQDDQIALAKALAESLERIVLSQYRFATSNGIAAHLDRRRANEAAASELLERDIFLCHFYTKTPFAKIADPNLPDKAILFRLWLENKNVRLRFYRLCQTGIVCAIDCRAIGSGISFGTAIKETPEASLISATIEAGRKIHRLLTGLSPSPLMSLEDFGRIVNPSFADHGALALDAKYAETISFLFDEADFSGLSLTSCDFTSLDLKGSCFQSCPLFFSRASSACAQDLFLGQPSAATINLDRLSEFCGRRMGWTDVLHLPHPID